MPTDQPRTPNPLADPALRQSLSDFVRRRVPSSDVDDVVQTILVDALAAEGRPQEGAELRKWLLGIARHKVADFHRRAHREPPAELPDIEASPAPIEARELVRWAEDQAGPSRDAKQTLDWMAREGEGEKLESIAASEKVPAARVRQRVSRMRRWMKERWLAELTAAAVLAIALFLVWRWLRKPEEVPEAKPEKPKPTATVEPSPLDEARALREKALDDCAHSAWQPCLDGLDKARALDPDGDKDPAIGEARRKAEDALKPPPPSDVKSAPTDAKNAPAPPPTVVPTFAPTGKPIPPKFAPKPPTKEAVPFEKTAPKFDGAKSKKGAKPGGIEGFDVGKK